MPIHTATFSQPGPELNPMRLSVPSPIEVEVYSSGVKNIRWTAREKSRQNDFALARDQHSAIAARYAVARLFLHQVNEWAIDGEFDPLPHGYHLHRGPNEPALCGSRFHVSFPAADGVTRVIELSKIRVGERHLSKAERESLCRLCAGQVDRSPQPGDAFYHRLLGAPGTILALPLPNQNPPTYSVYFPQEDQQSQITAEEIRLLVRTELAGLSGA